MVLRYPNKRKFGGKDYQLKGVSDLKYSADISAEQARRRGRKARVIKLWDGRWGIYIRQ